MLFEQLLEGRENARTGRELCQVLNCNPRIISHLAEQERREGKPIIAATGENPGYYLAATKEEMQQYCRSLKHRAGEIFKTRRACLKAAELLPGVDHEQQS